jgi:3-isopropylmalate/(R)-2-methylmalate dehydratase small subunit
VYRFGFRAVIAQSFAEIFFGNCTTLGIPCVTASAADIQALAAAVNADPALEVKIDVLGQTVSYGAQSFKASLPHSAHEALTTGHWDAIGELLEGKDDVAAKMKDLGWAA